MLALGLLLVTAESAGLLRSDEHEVDGPRLSAVLLPLLGGRDAGALQVDAGLRARPQTRAHPRAMLRPSEEAEHLPTRREALQQAAAAVASAVAVSASPAWADSAFNTANLQPYIDSGRGFKLYRPSGWNEFSADPGNYDVKFADIIEPETQIVVSSSPVTNATSVTAIGDLQAVGQKLAKSRGEEVVSAKEREVEGTLLYTYELQDEKFHTLLTLCITRGKLFRLTLSTSNKKWKNRAELYKNVEASFVPKGF